MSMDAQFEPESLSPEARRLFDQLVDAMAIEGFGEEPAYDTTFAEIEQYGHQVGRMVARALDAAVTDKHGSAHFTTRQTCPKCGSEQSADEVKKKLKLVTQDGKLNLAEPTYRCPACERDFFPSADSVEN